MITIKSTEVIRNLICPVKAAGNAFPVPLIIACLHPMLMAVAAAGGLPPHTEKVENVCFADLARFRKALDAKPKIVDKIAAAKHKASKRKHEMKMQRQKNSKKRRREFEP